jgi:hypothetical protein
MKYKHQVVDGCKIAVHDNGGRTCDRYTVIFFDCPCGDVRDKPVYECLAMDEQPCHPQGFGQHSSAMPGTHLGKRIEFGSLPVACRHLVEQDLAEIAKSLAKH